MAKRIDRLPAVSETEDLQRRLDEAEETLRAIRQGEVDALVIEGPKGEMIYTLTSADYPYRLMIDEMNEGAVSVSPDSFILYGNRESGHSYKVRLMLALTQTPHEYRPVEITTARDQRSAEFQATAEAEASPCDRFYAPSSARSESSRSISSSVL